MFALPPLLPLTPLFVTLTHSFVYPYAPYPTFNPTPSPSKRDNLTLLPISRSLNPSSITLHLVHHADASSSRRTFAICD